MWSALLTCLRPPLREQRPCHSNSTCCFRNFWNHVPLCLLKIRPRVTATVGVLSVEFSDFGVALARGVGATWEQMLSELETENKEIVWECGLSFPGRGGC